MLEADRTVTPAIDVSHVISRMSCLQHAIIDLIHASATLTINLTLNLFQLSSHILDTTKREVTPSRIHLPYLASSIRIQRIASRPPHATSC
jgi:hypothetical protein